MFSKVKVFLLSLAFAISMPSHANAGKLLPAPTSPKMLDTITINPERTVYLTGRVDAQSAEDVIIGFDALRDSDEPIYLVINSPGGSVTSGFEIIAEMEKLNAPLICVIESRAFSMAALIATYCPKLYIHKFAMMMFHQASYSVEGTETEIETYVATMRKYLDQLYTDVAKKLGISLEEYKAKTRNDWWITANEAAASGLADGVISKVSYGATNESMIGALLRKLGF